VILYTAIALCLLIFLSLPIAAALGLLAISLAELFAFFPLTRALGEVSWTASTEFVLVAVPMFILMGEILLRSGMAQDMYRALDAWVGGVPGGLMHTNVAACAMFAATSGSSVATAATISTVALPELERHGYDQRLFLGTLAAGGTLGILIPPSINMILYAVLAEESVTALYLAAIVPGLLLAGMFALMVLAACVIRPALGGARRTKAWAERRATLGALAPPLALFSIVVGTIYAGIATPTEASALGVIASLVFARSRGALNPGMLRLCFEGTTRTTGIVMLIVIAAFFLNFVMAGVGLTYAVTGLVTGLEWPPVVTMLAIIAFYLVLGCLMETLSLMIATTPVVVPIVKAIGYDPVWFGVVYMILLEAALITPPIGVNLYVVQSVRARGPFRDVSMGALPFVAVMIAMIGLLLLFPGLATGLPALIGGGH
jgi:tripartite ATP-independent transporter DctM subunit